MAHTPAKSEAEASDLGFCDNHPEVPAVHVTDGITHSVQRYCKGCLARKTRALNPGRRHG